jgi:hypothetical protein
MSNFTAGEEQKCLSTSLFPIPFTQLITLNLNHTSYDCVSTTNLQINGKFKITIFWSVMPSSLVGT